MDFDTLSIAELQEVQRQYGLEHAELRQKRVAVAAALDKKITAENVKRKLRRLSPGEALALQQLVQAPAPTSQSVVGEPGAN